MNTPNPQSVDFFVIFCGGMERPIFYVVPSGLVLGRSDMKVYPNRSKEVSQAWPEWEKYRDGFALLGAGC